MVKQLKKIDEKLLQNRIGGFERFACCQYAASILDSISHVSIQATFNQFSRVLPLEYNAFLM